MHAPRSLVLVLAGLATLAVSCAGGSERAPAAGGGVDADPTSADDDDDEEPSAGVDLDPGSAEDGSAGDSNGDDGSPTESVEPAVSTAAAAEGSAEDLDEGCSGEQIDVNSAERHELERIVHIGPARAGQVDELRPFTNLRDLTRVPGIGEKRFSEISEQDLACVAG